MYQKENFNHIKGITTLYLDAINIYYPYYESNETSNAKSIKKIWILQSQHYKLIKYMDL